MSSLPMLPKVHRRTIWRSQYFAINWKVQRHQLRAIIITRCLKRLISM
nr:MAG TPA: hypothetical protein [Caudoviricetes sp.]